MKHSGIKKLYYSISEVGKITGLEQYVLRYWETEFPELKPAKNRAGNRIYTNKDIKLIIKIKNLLRDEKYTIEGAKKVQDEETRGELIEMKVFFEGLLGKLEKN
jgi:DNA-binding transcriptional MerR regulator